ncbi:MAG: putative zinc-binding protein [Veillonellales bacterium]
MSTGCGQKGSEARICPEGARYVEKILAGPPRKAILACEGGCIKGEVARVAANILAYQLERDSAVRICLGDAVTGDSGFVELVKQAPETIIIEGCFLHCGTQIMKTRIPDFDPVVVEAIRLYSFNREKYFEIFDIPRSELEQYAKRVADYVQQTKFQGAQIDESQLDVGCCSCSSGK